MFDKLTYWNLETPPSSDDAVVMAMEWPELAEAVRAFKFELFQTAGTGATQILM